MINILSNIKFFHPFFKTIIPMKNFSFYHIQNYYSPVFYWPLKLIPKARSKVEWIKCKMRSD